MSFHIMLTSDVDQQIKSGVWEASYTTNESQKSDDGLYMWVVGEHDNTIESFDSYSELMDYCCSNGWTRPVIEDGFI